MEEQLEIWKPIDCYDAGYEISNLGRVKSIARRVSNHTGYINKKDYYLKIKKDNKGYCRVYLSKNKVTKFVPVHRLVAMAFIENPNNKPQVNHIDGNKTNNNVTNLEWCTNSENQIHAVRTGLNDHSKYNSGKKKKSVLQIDAITGEVIKEYNSIKEASVAVNRKSCANISACCKGKRNFVAGYKWKYKEVV